MTRDKLTRNRDVLTKLLAEADFVRELFGYLKKCGITGEDAKDPVQTALLRCWTGKEDLNEIRNPVSYIGRLAYWRARDQSRQNWRETPIDGTLEPAVQPFFLAKDLDFALSLLSEEDRWLIEKRYFDDAEYCELAEALGETCDCLQTRVRRILKRMRAFLERPGSLATGSENSDRLALVHRETIRCGVGRRNRRKSSTMKRVSVVICANETGPRPALAAFIEARYLSAPIGELKRP